MTEQFPDQFESTEHDQSQAEQDMLMAEHQQEVRGQVQILHRELNIIDTTPDNHERSALDRMARYAESEGVTNVPGAREATQGAVIGASRDRDFLTRYYTGVVEPSLFDTMPRDSGARRMVDSLIRGHLGGVDEYRQGQQAKTSHRQRFTGHLDQAAKTLDSYLDQDVSQGKMDAATAARTRAFVRGFHLGVTPQEGRSYSAKRLEATLLEA